MALTKDEARAKIKTIQEQIDGLWDECARIADKSRVTFYYGPPGGGDHGGGQYYPPKPVDWIDADWDDDELNFKHPEFEEYHPWNDTNECDYDWSEGHWVSSSSRC